MKFIENIKSAYATDSNELDRGDIVQTILIIAGFAIVCILAINWIGTSILNKGADVAACIEGSNTYNSASSAEACEEGDANTEGKEYFEDEGYKGRYN